MEHPSPCLGLWSLARPPRIVAVAFRILTSCQDTDVPTSHLSILYICSILCSLCMCLLLSRSKSTAQSQPSAIPGFVSKYRPPVGTVGQGRAHLLRRKSNRNHSLPEKSRVPTCSDPCVWKRIMPIPFFNISFTLIFIHLHSSSLLSTAPLRSFPLHLRDA